LRDKIATRPAAFEDVRADVNERAETLIISYGVPDGAARVAVRMLRAAGRTVSHLTLYSLWPLPERAVRAALTPRVRRVVVPELNIGLYVDELRRIVPGEWLRPVLRFDGGLIAPAAIAHAAEGGNGDGRTGA